MVINGEVDLLAYLMHYTSKWDTCAGEAIIKAMGGYSLSMKKETIMYDPQQKGYKNMDGIISSFDKDLFERVF